jgi:hypothetical protein
MSRLHHIYITRAMLTQQGLPFCRANFAWNELVKIFNSVKEHFNVPSMVSSFLVPFSLDHASCTMSSSCEDNAAVAQAKGRTPDAS